MYNSIDFFYIDPLTHENGSKKNTWEDWGLVGSSRPTIAPAKPITNLVKVTGMSGFYNASEILTGYPLYESRTGSFDFIVLNKFNKEDAKRWVDIYNEVCEYLNGQELCCVFEDEPEYYYQGVFSVSGFESGEYNSTITIDYEVQPYKFNRLMSDDDWLWDTFNFENGVVPSDEFKNITVSYGSTKIFSDLEGKIGQMPVTPEIVVKSWTTGAEVGASSLIFNATITDKRGKEKKIDNLELKRTDMYENPLVPAEGFKQSWTLPLLTLYDDVTEFSISTNDADTSVTFNLRFREGRI